VPYALISAPPSQFSSSALFHALQTIVGLNCAVVEVGNGNRNLMMNNCGTSVPFSLFADELSTGVDKYFHLLIDSDDCRISA